MGPFFFFEVLKVEKKNAWHFIKAIEFKFSIVFELQGFFIVFFIIIFFNIYLRLCCHGLSWQQSCKLKFNFTQKFLLDSCSVF